MLCIQLINFWWQVKSHNWNLFHDLPQTYGEANLHVRFGKIPQYSFYLAWVKVPLSIDADLVKVKTQVNNQQRNSCVMKLKEVLVQLEKSIFVNKYEHPNLTLVTTFLKPAVEANTYLWFGYGPKKQSITSDGKYQDQLMLIWPTWTKKSSINGGLIKTRTPKERTLE